MSTPDQTTQIIAAALLIVACTTVAAVDVWAGATGRQTVTDTLRHWSARWPILPFAIGLLVGHLLW